MPRVCLSYRRLDSAAIVGRIYDRLVDRYGAESVFMDLSDIPYGADFRKHIQAAYRDAEVLLAVIGPRWLGQDERSGARIEEKLDPVRVEIQTALRQRIHVIPVLVDGAKMPSADQLPRNIKEFAFRNAIHVDSGVDFQLHVERLMTSINEAVDVERTGKPAPDFATNRRPRPNVPKMGVANPPIAPSPARNWSARLVPYFVTPVILVLLAHYLIIMKLDLNPIYLRLVAMVIPLGCGFLLFRRIRQSVGAAALLGLGVSLVAVAGMMTIVGLVDGHAILPTGAAEWQEAAEYVVTITLATAAGNLLARVVYLTVPGRWRLF